jgi:hypothetical protein
LQVKTRPEAVTELIHNAITLDNRMFALRNRGLEYTQKATVMTTQYRSVSWLLCIFHDDNEVQIMFLYYLAGLKYSPYNCFKQTDENRYSGKPATGLDR